MEAASQMELLAMTLARLDGVADRVFAESGSVGMANLIHDMKITLYTAARDVCEQHDPNGNCCPVCDGLGWCDPYGCGMEIGCPCKRSL